MPNPATLAQIEQAKLEQKALLGFNDQEEAQGFKNPTPDLAPVLGAQAGMAGLNRDQTPQGRIQPEIAPQAVAEAPEAGSDEDLSDALGILFGEAANDIDGVTAKLNTYNKARKPGESLIDAMRRKSAAFYHDGGSPQFHKGKGGEFDNVIDQRAFDEIDSLYQNFEADENWPYSFHENPDLYDSEDAMIKHLAKAWGSDVDFEDKERIGKEYFFKKKQSPQITPNTSGTFE